MCAGGCCLTCLVVDREGKPPTSVEATAHSTSLLNNLLETVLAQAAYQVREGLCSLCVRWLPVAVLRGGAIH